ncbi:MAG: ferredoxin [Acidimicrobiales bacterium]
MTGGAARTVPDVVVDRDACMGSGTCVYLVPEVFDLDDGVAVVRGSVAGHGEQVRDAARHCPSRAIRVRDRAGDGDGPGEH